MIKVNGYNVNCVLICKDKDNLNQISVDISADPIEDNYSPVRVTTKDVVKYLKEDKNYKIDKCLKSAVVTNTSESSYFGTWIFSLIPDLTPDVVVCNSLIEEVAESKSKKRRLKIQKQQDNAALEEKSE